MTIVPGRTPSSTPLERGQTFQVGTYLLDLSGIAQPSIRPTRQSVQADVIDLIRRLNASGTDYFLRLAPGA